MFPISKSITGTGTLFITAPDICQNPFDVSISAQVQTGGGLTTAILSVEHTYDYRIVMAPSFNGLTSNLDGAVATAIWFTNAGLNTVTVTAGIGTGSFTATCAYTTPVAAIRANIISATATCVIAVNFIQATNAP